nr:PREDICTED: uncharacterized protein LOC105674954 isoform X2 [Linepithema humile]XP_012227095.1 PREDICTED: uncharacterized protein LOC105674954 isoform X2 [Linepithema humile]XP_012227096.1 PREDICTED: uncharacterized protein LOC105674954 isoform X2 [Linepithema humile]XP_012227097.1 PREDICTED: uncharacterized protein LOC105674954 isoform X2 [Linepithema humile]XP_012227098.1 PREDICTED: uncharacterized protein LOC105674954 isoform X2 [Linepithema humile]
MSRSNAKKVVIEQQLIDEVFRRSGLWNYNLPRVKRRPQVRIKLWKEVFAALDGRFSINLIKKKWKLLYNSFQFYLKKDQQAASGKKLWVHFQCMQFLRDLLESKNYRNIELPKFSDSHSDLSEMASPLYDSSTDHGSRISKRRMTEDTLDRTPVADPLDRTPVVDPLALPVFFNTNQLERISPCPQIAPQAAYDKPALIGNLVTALLRDVDPELLDEVMLDILKVTNAKKRKI